MAALYPPLRSIPIVPNSPLLAKTEKKLTTIQSQRRRLAIPLTLSTSKKKKRKKHRTIKLPRISHPDPCSNLFHFESVADGLTKKNNLKQTKKLVLFLLLSLSHKEVIPNHTPEHNTHTHNSSSTSSGYWKSFAKKFVQNIKKKNKTNQKYQTMMPKPDTASMNILRKHTRKKFTHEKLILTESHNNNEG